jgi:hypothetical protein
MQTFRWRLTILMLLLLACAPGGARAIAADNEPVPSRRANPVDPAAQTPVRLAQIDSHGRYPFGMYRGGYRYPFSYPYYRYYSNRQYPFGNGPYGPYGSNYGGYTGNSYDRGVYGTRGLPDAPAPPPDRAAPPRPREEADSDVADAGAVPLPVQPVPLAAQYYGEPIPYSGGSPFNPSYGGGQLYRIYPYGYGFNNLWFGQNQLIHGFGYYPMQNYSYFYGPPSGMGFYGPEYMPSYYNYSVRNFGPYYPGIGGVNGGAGFYQGGW